MRGGHGAGATSDNEGEHADKGSGDTCEQPKACKQISTTIDKNAALACRTCVSVTACKTKIINCKKHEGAIRSNVCHTQRAPHWHTRAQAPKMPDATGRANEQARTPFEARPWLITQMAANQIITDPPGRQNRLRRNCETDGSEMNQRERTACPNANCWWTLWNRNRRTRQPYRLPIAICGHVLLQLLEMEIAHPRRAKLQLR